jgi:glycosyltransferase involved in cell wall biosynthesis
LELHIEESRGNQIVGGVHMRIAEFGQKHIFTSEGGIEVVVTEQALSYAKKGNKVTVMDRWELDKPNREYFKVANLRIVKIPTLSNSKLNAQLYSLIASMQTCLEDYEVVHIHAEGPAVFLPMLKAFGKKVVVTVHGLDWQRAKWGKFASSYIRLGEAMIAKYADAIIVLNEETQNYFRDKYNRKTFIIPNGVTVYPTTDTNLIEKLGLEKGKYYLYIGRLVPEKRLDLLVDAYSTLETDKKLVIAGMLDESVKRQPWFSKAERNPNILLIGFVGSPLKEQLYSNAHCAILPSDLEGMSIALLEALGYGIRVLASDVPENKALLKEYGNTFKAGDVKSLESELERIDKLPFSRSKEQYEYIQNEYSWDTRSSQMLDLLKDVVLEGYR